jgi:hypothetical protein
MPGTIDCGGIFERCIALSLNTHQYLWAASQELFEKLIGFRLIAGVTRDDKVRHSVGASFRTWLNVIDL